MDVKNKTFWYKVSMVFAYISYCGRFCADSISQFKTFKEFETGGREQQSEGNEGSKAVD